MMNSSVFIAMLLFCGLAQGCSAGPAKQSDVSKEAFQSSLIVLGAKTLPQECAWNIESQFPSAWRSLARHGVSEESPGLFYIAAGDSFVWLDVVYIGPVGREFKIVWSAAGVSRVVSQAEFRRAITFAKADARAAKTQGSIRDHDACEYLVWSDGTSRNIHAAVMETRAVEVNGKMEAVKAGFREVREFLDQHRSD